MSVYRPAREESFLPASRFVCLQNFACGVLNGIRLLQFPVRSPVAISPPIHMCSVEVRKPNLLCRSSRAEASTAARPDSRGRSSIAFRQKCRSTPSFPVSGHQPERRPTLNRAQSCDLCTRIPSAAKPTPLGRSTSRPLPPTIVDCLELGAVGISVRDFRTMSSVHNWSSPTSPVQLGGYH